MTMSSRERATAAAAAAANMPACHEWSTEDLIHLFCALDGLKPIGINKHFYMALITERLSKSLNRDIPAEAIWAHLKSLYNLEILDDKEPLPFPNDEQEFSLPESEFAELMQKKRAESEEKLLNNETTNAATPRSSAATVLHSTNDNTTKGETPAKSNSTPLGTKDLDKKVMAKLTESSVKRGPKRTRGSVSHESPSTTPPPLQNTKRRRI